MRLLCTCRLYIWDKTWWMDGQNLINPSGVPFRILRKWSAWIWTFLPSNNRWERRGCLVDIRIIININPFFLPPPCFHDLSPWTIFTILSLSLTICPFFWLWSVFSESAFAAAVSNPHSTHVLNPNLFSKTWIRHLTKLPLTCPTHLFFLLCNVQNLYLTPPLCSSAHPLPLQQRQQ